MAILRQRIMFDQPCIGLVDPQRRADLLKLLRRGLNTWEPAPQWLVELQGELTDMEAKERS